MPQNPETRSLKLALTYAEFADAIGVSETTAKHLVRDGKISVVRFGPRAVRIPVTEIERYIEQNLEIGVPAA